MVSATAAQGRTDVRPDQHEAAGLSVITRSPDETYALGTAIGAAAAAGVVICLFGDLGSGKTKLTQGIAAGLSVPDTYVVTSPTFTYVNEYPGRLPLFHIDLYRISSPDELYDLGWEEYLSTDGVVVIEWAERAGPYLPEQRIEVAISILDVEERRFDITGLAGYPALLEALRSQAHER